MHQLSKGTITVFFFMLAMMKSHLSLARLIFFSHMIPMLLAKMSLSMNSKTPL